MKIKSLIINHKSLIVILLIAALLRLWKLGSIPPGLTPDEASLGYNAYSILKTGRDEYGTFMPVIFKSFGDYKPGFYIYLTVPSVALFGLNEFSVRLPSALAGIIAIVYLYLIIKEFKSFNKLKIENSLEIGKWKLEIEEIAAFLLAISPWHLQYSRGAWEANVTLTLTLAGIYFFLKFLKNRKYFIISSLFFALTLITYQGAKLSTAITIAVLVITFWREFWLKSLLLSKYFIIGLTTTFLISVPILFSFSGGQTGRLTVFSVFSYPRPTEYLQNFLNEGDEKVASLSYYIFHPESLNFTRGILGRWFNHFSGRFLFFEGDYQNPQHSAPNSGMLLLFDLILLPVGLFVLLKQKSKLGIFTILWLILSPLPAVLSRDQVHSIRAINMLIPLIIISSLGLLQIIIFLKSHFKNKFIFTTHFSLLTIVFIISFVYYLDAYFIHLPMHFSNLWGYDYKQITKTVIQIQGDYKVIQVQQSFAQPYIYFLFYGSQIDPKRYDPAKYQQQSKLVESEYKGDVGYITKLDNIQFVALDWSRIRGDHGSLIIGDSIRIPLADSQDPNQFRLIDDIKYLDGKDAFRIIEIK